MQVVEAVDELRKIVQRVRCDGGSIGLVPTMGYLHEGHLRLADAARAANELVVMSIFVNPTQFGPHEDFERYPRDADRDRQLAADRGVDVLFAPDVNTMYPGGTASQMIWVDPGELASQLCGPSRPGHFRGVVTVVSKLFSMVQPDRAYFGQKDAQQAVILSRLARDLAYPVKVVVVPTVREPDGLALSSRNVYLTADERAQAAALSRALSRAESAVEQGERDPRRIEAVARSAIENQAPLGRIDYVTAVDLHTLQPLHADITADTLLALAVYFGSTRLIDNVIIRPKSGD